MFSVLIAIAVSRLADSLCRASNMARGAGVAWAALAASGSPEGVVGPSLPRARNSNSGNVQTAGGTAPPSLTM